MPKVLTRALCFIVFSLLASGLLATAYFEPERKTPALTDLEYEGLAPKAEESQTIKPVINNSSAISQLISRPELSNQRILYISALNAIKNKQYKKYLTLRDQLSGYPLYPYLEYRYLIRHSRKITSETIKTFNEEYASKRWAGYLLDIYLRDLLAQQRDKTFIENYSDQVDDTELACEHIELLFQNGQKQKAYEIAAEMWVAPFSLPKSCDAMFARLIQNRGISLEQGRQRFLGAFNNGETTLAEYLVRFLNGNDKVAAKALLKVKTSPAQLAKDWPQLTTKISSSDSKLWEDAIFKAMKPYLRRDQKKSISFLNKNLKPLLAENPSALALWTKSTDYLIQREALNDLSKVPRLYTKLDKPQGTLGLEWLARSYLHTAKWKKLVSLIEDMPEKLAQTDTWKYWQIRAAQLDLSDVSKLPDEQLTRLKTLAAQTNFYGFSAAKQLGTPYQIKPQSLELDDAIVSELISDAHFIRAIEFYFHEAYNQANAEWYRWVGDVKSHENANQIFLTAAYVADAIGWHNQAISTAARSKAWSHYYLRFPDAHPTEFALQSIKLNQPTEWLYATARQESALSPRARSSVGALGLMQLMPNTAKQQAKQLGLSYSTSSLHEPSYNITLGSAYLNNMYHRFQNRALASAAYNAGPHRVDKWLKSLKTPIPVDAWIETIRFNETRQYVKNVLSFALIKQRLNHTFSVPLVGLAKQNKAFEFIEEQENTIYPFSRQIALSVDF